MSEGVSIKTEPFAKDYKQEDSTNDTNTLDCSTTKLENFTNMVNVIKEEELDLDKMEESLVEYSDNTTIDVIKKENVDEMDEFLPEASPSFYAPPSLHTWKSDDCTEVITTSLHTMHQQQHLTSTITQQISLPKLEIMDVHTEEDGSNDLEFSDNTDTKVNDNRDDDLNSTQIPAKHNCEICGRCYTEDFNLQKHMRNKHPSLIATEYVCEKCDKRFITQLGLDSHSYRMHPGVAQKPTEHKCELCGSRYKNSKHLHEHIRKKHPPIDSEYICKICHEIFTTQAGLYKHSYRKHPVATKHKCEICGSCYKKFKTLREHIRNKHP
ncbi:uncharacterized protein isoform X2 [Musca autumnalis]|uniref:uncharacterized protein isoform X2 n=1 Tax=Musca autumnalis TaxID=221902 RepID=UPI003CF4003F